MPIPPRPNKPDDLVKRYSKIRKPMPPPEQVEEDHRRKIEEEQAEHEAEEELRKE
jgi:hypothetical protein